MTVHRWMLPSDYTAPREARARLVEVLADHSRLDDVVQVVSELVANAVDHGQPPIAFQVERRGDRIRVEVSNSTAGSVPLRGRATLDDVRGRGLAIVDTLSSDWGWHHEDGHLEVWAELASTA